MRAVPSLLTLCCLVGGVVPRCAVASDDLKLTVQLRILDHGEELPSMAASPVPFDADTEAFNEQMRRLEVPIRAGEERQLTVLLVDDAGQVEDVTASPCVEYDASMPWRLNVGPSGLVRAVGDPGFVDLSPYGRALVNVGFARGGQIGMNEILFTVVP